MASQEAVAAIQLIDACEQALVGLRNLFHTVGDDRTRDYQVQKLLPTIQDNLRLLENKKVLRNSDRVDNLRQLTKALAQDGGNQIARPGPSELLANQKGSYNTYVMDGTGTQINNPAVYCEGPSGT